MDSGYFSPMLGFWELAEALSFGKAQTGLPEGKKGGASALRAWLQVAFRAAVVQRAPRGSLGSEQTSQSPTGLHAESPPPPQQHTQSTSQAAGGSGRLFLQPPSSGPGHTLPCGSADPRPAAPNPRSAKPPQTPTSPAKHRQHPALPGPQRPQPRDHSPLPASPPSPPLSCPPPARAPSPPLCAP